MQYLGMGGKLAEGKLARTRTEREGGIEEGRIAAAMEEMAVAGR